MRPVRAFVAIPISAACARALSSQIERLGAPPSGDAVRWVRTEDLHVTLRFLGDISPERIARLLSALEAELSPIPRFACRIERISLFPSARRPSVVAAMLEDSPLLARLASQVAVRQKG